MSGKTGAEVRYFFNSGFAVITGGRFLIFDYCNIPPFSRSRGREGGAVDVRELRDYEVTVFASHSHMDHFTPAVFKWMRELPNIRFVLSYDIDRVEAPGVIRAYPDRAFEAGGLKIRTLRSTDEGVAFVVDAGGLKIYHAGDLNWWHWAGEPDEENIAMGDAYKREIDKLKGEVFDLAFVPVDPRLGGEYLWGLSYFMRAADARVIFPMHFRNAYSVFDRLENDPAAESFKDKIVRITRRGQRFQV